MRVGYVRCSTAEQNEARQLKMMEEQKVEKIFVDKASGKNVDRKDPYSTLNTIQRRLKYGVDSESAVSICEKVFNDRVIAQQIVRLLGSKDIGVDTIIPIIQLRKEAILTLLHPYPRYFTERINRICSK